MRSEHVVNEAGSAPPAANRDEANDHLAHWLDTLPETIHLRDTLAAVEQRIIRRALRISDGNMAEAARRLGISRSGMTYKVRKHGLQDCTRIGSRGSAASG